MGFYVNNWTASGLPTTRQLNILRISSPLSLRCCPESCDERVLCLPIIWAYGELDAKLAAAPR